MVASAVPYKCKGVWHVLFMVQHDGIPELTKDIVGYTVQG